MIIITKLKHLRIVAKAIIQLKRLNVGAEI